MIFMSPHIIAYLLHNRLGNVKKPNLGSTKVGELAGGTENLPFFKVPFLTTFANIL